MLFQGGMGKSKKKIQMKDHLEFNKRAIWTKLIVIGLLLATATLDFLTFALKPQFWDFDMSPLVLLTNNIVIIGLVKFAVIGGIVYLLTNAKYKRDYWHFFWVLVSVYLILAQLVGFINNRQVAEQNPPPESAPSVEVRLQTGINFALIWAYYPIIFAMVSFKTWEWGWRVR